MKMKARTSSCFSYRPIHGHVLIFSTRSCISFPSLNRRRKFLSENLVFQFHSAKKYLHVCLSDPHHHKQTEDAEYSGQILQVLTTRRRDVLITPVIAIGAYILGSAAARADDKAPDTEAAPEIPPVVKVDEKREESLSSRIYDATVIGEPMALGKDNKGKVWEKLMNSRIVYLGEAEQVPIRDDKEEELEIVKNLRKRCVEAERPISLALEAFPCDLQEQLNQYMDTSELDHGRVQL